MPGNTRVKLGGATKDDGASMRPRLDAGEYVAGQYMRRDEFLASMRPRLDAGEYTEHAATLREIRQASMRPRLDAGEY